ncbi:hypothetical protein DICPUDRAFT_80302 [Dictyostelium purpureum]|uniref:Uncharacterized protein n=1 Tax=Dictyostelium purpureum TaxID=5786 RepID=F0ZQ36_DICPU|nr:uncharacterized protein DICPUDRAFT_80302 [Dictyostelium purpureum]EGC33942.1 hypothetical protein DICPUDRAFT_80302 [Dictyostelium purpureum]|eukprot:XP_003289524.1 hypothetical protein DICPUDRAFT_80302 [Dictyostelium purpureum]
MKDNVNNNNESNINPTPTVEETYHTEINQIFKDDSNADIDNYNNNNNNSNVLNNNKEFPQNFMENFYNSDPISEYSHVCIVNFSFTSNDIDSFQFSLISLSSNKIVLNQTLLLPNLKSSDNPSLNIYKRITNANKKFLELVNPYIASKKVLLVSPQSINLLLLDIPEDFTIVDFQIHSLKANIPSSSWNSFRNYYNEKRLKLDYNFSLVSLFTDLFRHYINKRKSKFLAVKRKRLDNIISKNIGSYPFFKGFIFTSFQVPKPIIKIVSIYVEKKLSMENTSKEIEKRKKRIEFLKSLKGILDQKNFENVDLAKLDLKQLIKDNINNPNYNINDIFNNLNVNNKSNNNNVDTISSGIDNNNNNIEYNTSNSNNIDSNSVNNKTNNQILSNNIDSKNNNHNTDNFDIDKNNNSNIDDMDRIKKDKQIELVQFLKSFIREEKKHLYNDESTEDISPHLDEEGEGNSYQEENQSLEELFEKQQQLLIEFEQQIHQQSKNNNNYNFYDHFLIQQDINEKLTKKLKSLKQQEKQNKLEIDRLEIKVKSLQNSIFNFKNNDTTNNNNNNKITTNHPKTNPNLKLRRMHGPIQPNKKIALFSKLSKHAKTIKK